MRSVVPEGGTLVKWSGEAYRLIPSRFPPVNVYEGLIAGDRQEEITAAENLTNPRLRSLGRLSASVNGDVAADPRLQNWNLAPFAYGNPDGTLFFGEDRPCLELSAERQTALAVSVAKREAFLRATNEASTGLDMRMLATPVRGMFWDLRAEAPLPAGLSESQRRAIGKQMPEAAQGILYRPVERPTGICLAIVTGDVLQRSQQTVHYRYMWDGRRISMLYAFDQEGTRIPASELARDHDILTAA